MWVKIETVRKKLFEKASLLLLLLTFLKQKADNLFLKQQESGEITCHGCVSGSRSGFWHDIAYAHRNAPDQVFIVENWPSLDVAGGRRYCKTQTSLFYAPTAPNGSLELKAWGWPALVEYVDAIDVAKRHRTTQKESSQYNGEVACITDVKNGDYEGYFITKFKLFLAPGTPEPKLPSGLTVGRLITDYLKAISKFIMDELRSRYGKHLAKSDVEWCLTVPAIWDDGAKQKMEMYAEKAGLVKGSYCTEADASPHPLNIILEPEAASMYAQKQLQNLNWKAGDKFLVVDIGGGTIDLALHERVDHNSFQVLEAARNTGDMGGGTFVDDNFMKFVWEKIKCFKAFCHQDPKTGISLFNWWLEKKCAFDGSTSFEWDIPAKLASAWKKDDASNRIKRSDEEYYEMGINQHELSLIFDTEISKVIHLIREQQQLSSTQVKCILVVGGFSDNRYLRKCIKKSFVDEVICPPNPGSAVCHGAVTLGFQAHLIRSRVCKRTYGIESSISSFMAFRVCDSMALKEVIDGIEWCKNCFSIMVRKNQSVAADFVTSHIFKPVYNDAITMDLTMYSSSSENPQFTSEVGCVKEGTYTMDISEGLSLGKMRQVEVTMWFGKSKIEVTARRVNFGNQAPEKLYSVHWKKLSLINKVATKLFYKVIFYQPDGTTDGMIPFSIKQIGCKASCKQMNIQRNKPKFRAFGLLALWLGWVEDGNQVHISTEKAFLFSPLLHHLEHLNTNQLLSIPFMFDCHLVIPFSPAGTNAAVIECVD